MGNDKLHLRHPLFPFFSFFPASSLFPVFLSLHIGADFSSVSFPPPCETNPLPLSDFFLSCFFLPPANRIHEPAREQDSRVLGTGFPGVGNRIPRRWEQDSQALGTGFPGVGNNRPGIQGHLCNVVCCFWSECFPFKPSERQERGLRAAVIIRFVSFYFAVHALCRTFAVQSRSI